MPRRRTSITIDAELYSQTMGKIRRDYPGGLSAYIDHCLRCYPCGSEPSDLGGRTDLSFRVAQMAQAYATLYGFENINDLLEAILSNRALLTPFLDKIEKGR